MTATWFSFGVGQFEASCFLQTPDSEVAHVKRSTNVEGHVLFIGREGGCCFSDGFMELSRGLDS